MSDIVPGVLSPGGEICALDYTPTPLLPPSDLTQSIAMPDPENSEGDGDFKLAAEEVGLGTELGQKIGHFQAGSGVILSASGTTAMIYEVYSTG
jgi:hypothetical protein